MLLRTQGSALTRKMYNSGISVLFGIRNRGGSGKYNQVKIVTYPVGYTRARFSLCAVLRLWSM